MIELSEAVLKVIAENEEHGYVASKIEIANEIWHSYLSMTDRTEIMKSINIEGLTELGALRACVKNLSQIF